jgi:hypothetical protein
MLQFEGVVSMIGETRKVSEKFSCRDIWVRDDSTQYPQTVCFQFSQDRCDLIDQYKEGESVKVSFNLRGRIWTGNDGIDKCFNTLDAWRIERLEQPEPMPPTPSEIPQGIDDDLPF